MSKETEVTKEEIKAAIIFWALPTTSSFKTRALAQYAKHVTANLQKENGELRKDLGFTKIAHDHTKTLLDICEKALEERGKKLDAQEKETTEPVGFNVREFTTNICTAINATNQGNRYIAREITDKWLSILQPSLKEQQEPVKEQATEQPVGLTADQLEAYKNVLRKELTKGGNHQWEERKIALQAALDKLNEIAG